MTSEKEQRPGEERAGPGRDAVEEQQSASGGQVDFEAIPRVAIKVITNPVGFYQNMK